MSESFKIMPGLDGVPYRHYEGEPDPIYRTSDPYAEKPVMRRQMHCRVLTLSDDKQREEYERILSTIADSPKENRISTEQVQWDATRGTYVAFIRWETRWLERPKKVRRDEAVNVVYSGASNK